MDTISIWLGSFLGPSHFFVTDFEFNYCRMWISGGDPKAFIGQMFRCQLSRKTEKQTNSCFSKWVSDGHVQEIVPREPPDRGCLPLPVNLMGEIISHEDFLLEGIMRTMWPQGGKRAMSCWTASHIGTYIGPFSRNADLHFSWCERPYRMSRWGTCYV